jgi:hypothetical protein
MFQLTHFRAALFYVAMILLAGCAAPVAQDKQKTESSSLSWRDRVAAILQPGWEVTQADSSIVITRLGPVTYYNPIALPPPGGQRTEMIERSRHKRKYQITLDIVEKLSDEKYEELKAVNAKTEKEIEAKENGMRKFAGKGDFMPDTPEEQALYKEYQTALANLPYHRLPDLYDEKHSIYVKTTRHPWSAFYFAREELECRAVLENIYSFADAYEGRKSIAWPPGAEHARVAAFEAFESRRAYDRYLHKKEMNLKGQQKD